MKERSLLKLRKNIKKLSKTKTDRFYEQLLTRRKEIKWMSAKFKF